LRLADFCGRNRCADAVKTVFPENDRMRKICADPAEISCRPDLLLNEYQCYRPQYNTFFNKTNLGPDFPCRLEIAFIEL
jgi:hypothetical protein